MHSLRGSGKSINMQIFDDYYDRSPEVELSNMIQRFRESEVATECYFIKQGMPVSITIPPKTNLVQFLRLMFLEHGSGKLYMPRVLNHWESEQYAKWSVLMWGGGRQKANKIKVIDIALGMEPKTLQLIELMSG